MLTRPKSDWRTEAEADRRQANIDNAKRIVDQQIAFNQRVDEGAAKLQAMTEEERFELYARADVARAERLAKLSAHQLDDKERQRQGEFTNDAANYDEAREAQDHR
jgi:hypothetical protein